MAAVSLSFNPYIDALIKKDKLDNTNLTYYFATLAIEADPTNPTNTSFVGPLSDEQKTNFVLALNCYSTVCNLTFRPYGYSSIIQSNQPSLIVASWDFEYAGSSGGQQLKIDFGAGGPKSAPGSYNFQTYVHELGHSLGLRHNFETGAYFGSATPYDHSALDYTVMDYSPDFVGGYATNKEYFQTIGIDDIRAMQYMYGPNFNTNSGDTTYTWDKVTGVQGIDGSQQSRPSDPFVFAALWDGGGEDTFDLRLFSTNLKIDLRPGQWSSFGTLLPRGDATAIIPGNISNPYLYVDPVTGKEDLRSLIENVKGGSGNDLIIGNVVVNKLWGNAGNDTLDGGEGADFMYGGIGDDTYYVDNAGDVVDEQGGSEERV